MANFPSTSNRVNLQNNVMLDGAGVGGNTGVRVQYCFYENRYYGGNLYFHYKTNIPYTQWAMYNIEAVGYNYGSGQPIRCTWNFHISYGNGFYSVQYQNTYSGLSANTLYRSSDGYVVLVANAPSAYFAGWSFNAYTTNAIPQGGFEISMLAVAQTASNANYY
jgi:hypothetical protein